MPLHLVHGFTSHEVADLLHLDLTVTLSPKSDTLHFGVAVSTAHIHNILAPS